MHPALAGAYARLASRMDEATFLARIERERATFDGLLDDEALALLILDEEGLNDGAYVTLDAARGRPEATVRVTVQRVDPVRVFTRKSGGEGRVAHVHVADATGDARLVLWDRNVERAEDGTLRVGARLTVVNARVKDHEWGLELHASPWTALEVEGALDPAKAKLLADVAVDDATPGTPPPVPDAEGVRTLAGRVAWVGPTRPMRGSDGRAAFEADLDVETSEGIARVVLKGESVREARRLTVGTRVRVESLVARSRGAATEWHATQETRIVPE